MNTIFQTLLISTIIATTWVNAVLLEVTHNNHDYYLCSVDHEFPRDVDDNPFCLLGEVDGEPHDNARVRTIKNTSPNPIWIGSGFPAHSADYQLDPDQERERSFGRTDRILQEHLGHYVIVTLEEGAEINLPTWEAILKENHENLKNAVINQGKLQDARVDTPHSQPFKRLSESEQAPEPTQ
ncbi:hypothetical protein PGT21_017453 [Puccinia graminis f. sp. tritici]|uniref:Uncharacterized protein n=1 Tax=Puccinia graminis f. sp. tritici TaxID=56615 RepID=A0A5B0RFL4_PUCGR|nr:hypothetical protein PGT21_017453 [Puccinia graminis f. sp. tritici]KAA1124671.1 hypothetical protein PGTUg99_028103 [Puccinia graminis f. sp. tritici]